ncbi:hypothetical protein Cni_G15608 [Canna indica]|uniref:Macro domain-containing protein n=1 Tax=Canna indica TaxID=4628 RepID=A0AAQ3KEP9_9LILI|nr:hypothetical protein Cni_G15608 [Canna indica]
MDCDPNIHQSPPRQGEEVLDQGKMGLVVILVGAPGSGKSTFCNDVMVAARRPWVRVCQDTIGNGKQGTKLQCQMSATAALKDGKSVFIDRCNIDQEQRVDFVKLSETGADVHAVVLDLPAKLCISRSVKRSGHEGKLQGGRAAVVVNRMLQKKELPKLCEGFSRITFCQNESDVKDAVKTYSALGPSDTLPAGVFGEKSKESKVQLGIMKFLKKVEKPDKDDSGKDIIPDEHVTHDIIPRPASVGNTCTMELENKNEDDVSMNDNSSSQRSFIGDNHGVPTLAFPSISTADFQFDIEKASDIIVDSVSDFLKRFNNVRLVLVDLSVKSKILSLVREKSTKKHIDSSKFFTFVGDITQLYTRGKLKCNVIANAANWRLRPGGGGVNAAIFKAAGKSLENATKECAETLSPGNSVVVPLPSNSPLHLREGVTHVIHVLGPNMNPQRPNCLNNDYIEGCKVLCNAYSSLFANFASIFKDQIRNESKRNSSGISDSHNLFEGTTSTYSHDSDQKIKQEGHYNSEKNKKYKGFPYSHASKDKVSIPHEDHGYVQSEAPSDVLASNKISSNSMSRAIVDCKIGNNKRSAEVRKRTWGAWAQALHDIALNPEKHKDVVMEMSDAFVVLNDMYPKAKKHILVVSRLQGFDCLADVQQEHLSLLKKMHSAGAKWADRFLREDSSLIFRLGYHSVPSMRQLHLHVISQDFDSTHLKNKKHWNSFNTSFFRDSTDVLEEIEKHGVVTVNDDEKLLTKELRCHKCCSAHPNIPRLKSHITNCKAPLPTHLHDGKLVYAPSNCASGTSSNLS